MFTSNSLEKYFEELSEQMWTLLPVDPDYAATLLNSAKSGPGFRQAGVGGAAVKATDLRSDCIRWVESNQGATEAALLNDLAGLRQSLQDYFRIHLEKTECHFSIYEPGQYYVRHNDTDVQSHRIFSFVIYLNAGWKSGDGGELRGYAGAATAFEVEPRLGNMILFRSDVEHEVLPANRTRYALTGWFRK